MGPDVDQSLRHTPTDPERELSADARLHVAGEADDCLPRFRTDDLSSNQFRRPQLGGILPAGAEKHEHRKKRGDSER
jgi:hypothetical protein